MSAGSVLRRLVEKFKRIRKSQIGVGRAQGGECRLRGVAFDGHVFLYKHRGSARRLEEREVLAVREKCHLARTGVLDASDAGNFKVGRAFQAAAQFLSKFGEFHGRSSS